MNPGADLLVVALAFLGFAALSASMDRHAKQLFRQSPPPAVRRLRALAGVTALLLALIPAIDAYGPSVGIAVWLGFLAVVSTLLGVLLAYRLKALQLVFSVAAAGALLAALLDG
jgi:hypothetical protein